LSRCISPSNASPAGKPLGKKPGEFLFNGRANQREADSVVGDAQALGVGAISIIADMAKKDQVKAMAAKALSEFGRVDILINNAAIRLHMPFRELTDEDWEHVRNVVLDGALYLTRALIGPMVENKYGNICSSSATEPIQVAVAVALTFRQPRWR
jgi:3-oxoacyl-[acyl-carrier protein] reductase